MERNCSHNLRRNRQLCNWTAAETFISVIVHDSVLKLSTDCENFFIGTSWPGKDEMATNFG